jgi:hypothetical protein
MLQTEMQKLPDQTISSEFYWQFFSEGTRINGVKQILEIFYHQRHSLSHKNDPKVDLLNLLECIDVIQD